MHIPFNRPAMMGNEQAYMAQAVANGHISGGGPFARQCQELLAAALNVPAVLLTTSCTHALEMAALLLDLQEGDEVIVPSFTFPSTANAFALRGARAVFIDSRPDTLNLDEALLPCLLTPRTRAIFLVHYAGVGCEMTPIMDIAARAGVAVVEDNAHGLFGAYHGRALGSFGSLATLSFHETKNFSCGEGGALLINDLSFLVRAEIIREKGTNRNRFFRGEVDKYTWVDLGSSYVPADLLAAYLYAQLEAREAIQCRRQRAWEYYHSGLASWATEHHVRVPVIPAHCTQAYHMYYLLLPSPAARQTLIERLKAQEILGVSHYQPLHLSVMGRRFGGVEGQCPVTEAVSECLLRLPFYTTITTQEQDRVMDVICSVSTASW
jgi:dTDP-4-amino-4,6-dideoxygalactose transaminase